MKRVMKPLKEFNSTSENGLNIETRLYELNWNGEYYTIGLKNGEKTEFRYKPVYDLNNKIIGFEEVI